MANTMLETPACDALHWNVLDAPLIRWRSAGDGALHTTSLPELLAAMAADQVRDFPALRAHQRHPWHAFLVQLGALALHRARQEAPWQEAGQWRAALLALTPDDADGAPWCLVAPADRPALLQPPVPNEVPAKWSNLLTTPDAMDMLVTSKNHDLKAARMCQAQPEDWLFALLSLQTQEGFLGAGNYGISRMNGGFANRPGVGVAQVGAWGQRWRSDVHVLLTQRERIAGDHSFAYEDGHALLWLLPWSGAESLALSSLDPFYIEICRRVRLVAPHGKIQAHAAGSKTTRVAAKDSNGVTGDAWTPVEKAKAKALTVSAAGFDYKLMTELLAGERFAHGAAWRLNGWASDARLEVLARAAVRGQGKTEGFHERRVPVSPKLRRLLMDNAQRPLVAALAQKHIQAIGDMRKLLWSALAVLFANGESVNGNDAISARASRFAQPFEVQEDSRFFTDLTQHAEAEGEQQDVVYVQWLLGLAQRAEALLLQSFDAGPRSGMQRYKARASALARFHGGLRSGKGALSELASHYAAQKNPRPSAPEGDLPCPIHPLPAQTPAQARLAPATPSQQLPLL